MSIRQLIACSFVLVLFIPAGAHAQSATVPARLANSSAWDPSKLGETLLRDPVWVYNDWSSYDELSDNIPLTEEVAMKELNEIVRLRKFGVHFDYYMMDAFWFDLDGGYRTWRKPNWPNGPDRWIAACQQNGLKPGLWFSTNTLVKINATPQWKDSLNSKGGSMSFVDGGFLPDFINVLQYWYNHGIRAFKFDFVDLDAVTPANERAFSRDEIRQRNATAFREALKKFRTKNPDVLLVAFNGFGGDMESTAGPFPFRNPIDLRWLEVFDSMYSGDPRPSDVPETNFWRSMDIYSDHMVRRYGQSGLPLERIDSTGMMIGNTGTIYYRKTNAWQGMLWGMMARGGWVNTIHGNLEFLDADKACWFARAQHLFAALQAEGRTKAFGGIPGNVEAYGFGSFDTTGSVYTVVNPSQAVQEISLPRLSRVQGPLGAGGIIFRDAGFAPILRGGRIDSDWNSRNTIIQYNYSHDNDGGFLLICNEGSQSPSDSAGNVGTIVRYNISQNDHHRAIKLSGPVRHTLIYNNTIYVGKGENVDVVLHTDWTGWASDTYFFNNIFYVEGHAQFAYGVSGNPDGSYVSAPGPGKSTSNLYDYNVYFGLVPPDDPHAITADPLLLHPGHAENGRSSVAGYALRSHSPAIGSGKIIEGNGGKDFFGAALHNCPAVDRGAVQNSRCGAP